MSTFKRVCYFSGCDSSMSAPAEDIVEGMFLTHIRLVHLDDLLAERTTRLNSIQAKNAEDNVARFEKLRASGLEPKEIVSLIGNPGASAMKSDKDSDDKVELPEWAKDQSYESWKIEFNYYKDTTLGAYKNAELISESNRIGKTDLELHKSDEKVKILNKIRCKLVASLKKCENEKVKDFVINSIMNNTAVSGNLKAIMEKIEDRFGVSDKIKHDITMEDFHNFKYTGSTSDIIDKIEILRRRLNKSFDIRDPPINVIGDKVQSRDEAKGKIEAKVIISYKRSKINLYFHTNFHVHSFNPDLGMI